MFWGGEKDQCELRADIFLLRPAFKAFISEIWRDQYDFIIIDYAAGSGCIPIAPYHFPQNARRDPVFSVKLGTGTNKGLVEESIAVLPQIRNQRESLVWVAEARSMNKRHTQQNATDTWRNTVPYGNYGKGITI